MQKYHLPETPQPKPILRIGPYPKNRRQTTASRNRCNDGYNTISFAWKIHRNQHVNTILKKILSVYMYVLTVVNIQRKDKSKYIIRTKLMGFESYVWRNPLECVCGIFCGQPYLRLGT